MTRRDGDISKLLRYFVSRYLNEESPVRNGEGTQVRDFLSIDDVIAANVTLLDEDTADDGAVNVGSIDIES